MIDIYDEIEKQQIKTNDKILKLVTDKLSLEYTELTLEDLKQLNKLRKDLHNLYKIAIYINANNIIDWEEEYNDTN